MSLLKSVSSLDYFKDMNTKQKTLIKEIDDYFLARDQNEEKEKIRRKPFKLEDTTWKMRTGRTTMIYMVIRYFLLENKGEKEQKEGNCIFVITCLQKEYIKMFLSELKRIDSELYGKVKTDTKTFVSFNGNTLIVDPKQRGRGINIVLADDCDFFYTDEIRKSVHEVWEWNIKFELCLGGGKRNNGWDYENSFGPY